jgi:hypothetical protein
MRLHVMRGRGGLTPDQPLQSKLGLCAIEHRKASPPTSTPLLGFVTDVATGFGLIPICRRTEDEYWLIVGGGDGISTPLRRTPGVSDHSTICSAFRPWGRSVACRVVRALPLGPRIRLREKSNFASRFNADSTVQSSAQRYLSSVFRNRCDLVATSRLDAEGVVADVRRGCGGRVSFARRTRPMRAAKACGPGLPTLRPSSRDDDLAGDGGKKAVPRESAL